MLLPQRFNCYCFFSYYHWVYQLTSLIALTCLLPSYISTLWPRWLQIFLSKVTLVYGFRSPSTTTWSARATRTAGRTPARVTPEGPSWGRILMTGGGPSSGLCRQGFLALSQVCFPIYPRLFSWHLLPDLHPELQLQGCFQGRQLGHAPKFNRDWLDPP